MRMPLGRWDLKCLMIRRIPKNRGLHLFLLWKSGSSFEEIKLGLKIWVVFPTEFLCSLLFYLKIRKGSNNERQRWGKSRNSLWNYTTEKLDSCSRTQLCNCVLINLFNCIFDIYLNERLIKFKETHIRVTRKCWIRNLEKSRTTISSQSRCQAAWFVRHVNFCLFVCSRLKLKGFLIFWNL